MASLLFLQLSLITASLIPTILIVSAMFVSRRSPFAAAAKATVIVVELSVMAVTLRGLSFVARIAHGYEGAEDSKLTEAVRTVVRLEVVSCAMLVLVCTLAVVVVRYSQRYLAGEGGLVRYSRTLLLTLAAVTILVISNHLGLMVAAWFGTGIGLHQLLTFYRNRRQAIIVAHKEFLLSRIADLCFLGSLALVHEQTGSLHINEVNAFAMNEPTFSPSLHLATILLVFGVILKSAQLPFHGWMQQVMEAPTPVSALLHAGVVNIGGYVMIRLAPLMARATIAQWILVYVGLATAIVGSLIMTTRVSIKLTLAWSTIAQMGFMLVQCGLGVWHLALLHLLAHSLYKAHSFLSAGSVVENWRGHSLVHPRPPSLRSMAVAAGILCIGAVPLVVAFVFSPLHASTSLAPLALALLLSFVPVIARAHIAGKRPFKLAVLFTAGATALYFGWHALFDVAAEEINAGTESPFKWFVVVMGLLVLFVAQTVVQTSPNGRLARLLQPHLFSGLYIDEWFTRMTFRLWPPRLDRAAVARRSAASLTREAR